MIPAILHQSAESHDILPDERRWQESWLRHNPGMTLRFLDNAERRAFVERDFPQYLDLIDGLKFGVMKSDLFRYLSVYKFGGVYADLDVECHRSFDDFLAMDGAIFGVEARVTRERQRELGYARPFHLASALFMAEPGHPFLAAIVERLTRQARANMDPRRDEIEDVVGPKMLTRTFYDNTPAKVQILAQTYWSPSRSYPFTWPLNRNIHARHHFAGVWKDERFANRPFRRKWIERDILPNPFPRRMFVTDVLNRSR